MGKISFMFMKKDCMGCHACEVACKQENGLGVGPRLVRVIEKSPDFVPVYCHHCAKAPCLGACPVEAIHRNHMGIVLIENELCIGCKECMEACPFGAMQFDENSELAIKCNLCLEKLEKGERTACSQACPTQCIFVGHTKELSDELAASRA